nr:unnamed protein product [Callosobruchus analis]
MWKIIKGSRQKQESPSTNNLKAQKFNDLFIKIAQKVTDKLPVSDRLFRDFMPNNIPMNFSFHSTTFNTVRSIIFSFKNKKIRDCHSSSVQLQAFLGTPMAPQPIQQTTSMPAPPRRMSGHRMGEARPPNMFKWHTNNLSKSLQGGPASPRHNREGRVCKGRIKGDQVSRDRLLLGARNREDVAEALEKGPRGDAEVAVRRNKENVTMEQRSGYSGLL